MSSIDLTLPQPYSPEKVNQTGPCDGNQKAQNKQSKDEKITPGIDSMLPNPMNPLDNSFLLLTVSEVMGEGDQCGISIEAEGFTNIQNEGDKAELNEFQMMASLDITLLQTKETSPQHPNALCSLNTIHTKPPKSSSDYDVLHSEDEFDQDTQPYKRMTSY
ncbi:hypothetical protein H5410_027673 [Solanum commersonii]|uniref:Uncharacterized protein n=1 Tax=Solanum commersonii TaxID=4109 RepID=A0A9J5Z1X1_SOLCO|nr:hypothetical protein H5410_027673 [Solanum commersonii]